MFKKLSIAGTLTLLVVVSSLFVTLPVMVYLVYKECRTLEDQAIKDSASLVRSVSQELQLAVYYHDIPALERVGSDVFFRLKHIKYFAVYDRAGALIIDRYSPGAGAYELPAFSVVREGLESVEQGRVARVAGTGEKIIDFSAPVLSLVSPLKTGLTREAFVGEVVNTYAGRSLHVAGYLRLGISQSDIEAEALDYARLVGVFGLLFVLTSGLAAMVVTRRVTTPLFRLAQVAQDIADGKLDSTFRVKGSNEVQHIASMLNLVIDGLSEYKTKIDVDNVLLGLKVDERTAELSERNRELNRAVEEVTHAKNRLRQLAYFDSLTALPNRRLFAEQLGLLLRVAKREKYYVALLFLDLDNFKRINDSLGHSAGDLVLQEVGLRLSECMRDSDLVSRCTVTDSRIGVSRLGGDEFTVVLNNVKNTKTVAAVAERLLAALAVPIAIEGHELVVTPSIGVAVAPRDGDDVETLLKHADTAMYHAKTGGKNSYKYYSKKMMGTGVERLKLESDLRRAIERGELILHYQPQVDLDTGDVVGAEAMVRWNHPQAGLVPPMEFIPLAEEMGLIVDLGRWVLSEACRQMKAFQQKGLYFPKMAVNVSSLQFNQAFIDYVDSVLTEMQLGPEFLELELTEGIIMSDANASIEVLQTLKRLGVSLSVDDFGTGYSSLSYLSRFPLDELKIDRSFVTELASSENSRALVRAIIAMGKSLGLRLVAEGVENFEQYSFLKNHGLKVIQGYLFSKALPVEEFEKLLQGHPFREQIKTLLATSATAADALVIRV